jgi:hypothetical protein
MGIRSCLFGIVVLVLVFSISVALKAQDVASITGLVTDQTGAQFAPGTSIAIDQTAAFNLVKTVGANPRSGKKM